MFRDHGGQITFEAVRSSDIKARQKALLTAYAEALRGYGKADSTAAPKPQRPAMRVLQSKVCGSGAKDKAETLAAGWQKKYEEKMAKKDQPKPEEAAPAVDTGKKG